LNLYVNGYTTHVKLYLFMATMSISFLMVSSLRVYLKKRQHFHHESAV
jgi:hypothetical protein